MHSACKMINLYWIKDTNFDVGSNSDPKNNVNECRAVSAFQQHPACLSIRTIFTVLIHRAWMDILDSTNSARTCFKWWRQIQPEPHKASILNIELWIRICSTPVRQTQMHFYMLCVGIYMQIRMQKCIRFKSAARSGVNVVCRLKYCKYFGLEKIGSYLGAIWGFVYFIVFFYILLNHNLDRKLIRLQCFWVYCRWIQYDIKAPLCQYATHFDILPCQMWRRQDRSPPLRPRGPKWPAY